MPEGEDALESAGERGLEPVRELSALSAQGACERVLEERGELGREAVVEARAGAQAPTSGTIEMVRRRVTRPCWAARRSMRSAGKRRMATRAKSLSFIRNIRVWGVRVCGNLRPPLHGILFRAISDTSDLNRTRMAPTDAA